jgi:hypothetical protein
MGGETASNGHTQEGTMNASTAPRLIRLSALAAFSIGTAAAAEITLFKQPNFSGEALTLRDDATHLGNRGFLDQVSSIDVKSGQWQFCTQPDFKGDCVVLDRGRYPSLEQTLNHRIESVREVTRHADRGRDERYYEGARRASRAPAVELFGAPDFRGKAMALNRDADTLFDGRFDQRAASLVINEGTWELCTDPGYEGVCRVFEPGSYESLGRLHRRVGSLRRIG